MIESLFPGLFAMQNVHPLLVHFPIAFFLGALAMEGFAVLRDKRFHFVATWMLYLGAFSALIAVPTGFMATNQVAASDPRGHGSPGHDFIHIHRNWMVATTLLGSLLAFYVFQINREKKWEDSRWRFLIALALLAARLVLGVDRGGRLVFEFGVGVNPDVIKHEHGIEREEKNHDNGH